MSMSFDQTGEGGEVYIPDLADDIVFEIDRGRMAVANRGMWQAARAKVLEIAIDSEEHVYHDNQTIRILGAISLDYQDQVGAITYASEKRQITPNQDDDKQESDRGRFYC